MKIGIWNAVVASHRLMGIIFTEHMNEPDSIRARMAEEYPFSKMTHDDREIVIALAWRLAWSP